MAVGVGNDLVHQIGVIPHAAEDGIGWLIVACRWQGQVAELQLSQERRAASAMASSTEAKWPLWTAACSERSRSWGRWIVIACSLLGFVLCRRLAAVTTEGSSACVQLVEWSPGWNNPLYHQLGQRGDDPLAGIGKLTELVGLAIANGQKPTLSLHKCL
jgi:hypothetical protein